jgi:hypothetical protein
MEKRVLSLTAATILTMVSFTFALETDTPDPTNSDFIIRDMRGDARNYAWVKSVTYPDSFTHEVDGAMVYDSITQYSEAMENNGRMHRATVRLTVGYTVENGMPSVYALVLKVI